MTADAGKDGQKAEYDKLINSLKLNEEQKNFLTSRWLDQVLWMEGRAKPCQQKYYLLRIAAIAGGILVPALGAFAKDNSWAQGAVVIIGLLVALATALEEFFKFGERWRHYRRVIEALKHEWWSYYGLCGPYAGMEHAAGFSSFADKVEALLAADVEAFLTKLAAEAKQKPAQP